MRTFLLLFLFASFCASIGTAKADFFSDISRAIAPPNLLQQIDRSKAQIKEQTPVVSQAKLAEVFEELGKIPEGKLYLLKAASDPCSLTETLDCKGLPSASIKPAIDVTLDQRKAIAAREDTIRTFYVSAGSLVVSGLSLIFSFFVFLKKPDRARRKTAARA